MERDDAKTYILAFIQLLLKLGKSTKNHVPCFQQVSTICKKTSNKFAQIANLFFTVKQNKTCIFGISKYNKKQWYKKHVTNKRRSLRKSPKKYYCRADDVRGVDGVSLFCINMIILKLEGNTSHNDVLWWIKYRMSSDGRVEEDEMIVNDVTYW